MFKSRNISVTGEDVINNLISSYGEVALYTGESDIIHELRKALNGEDSFDFGKHGIVVSAAEGQFMSQMMQSNAKAIFKWPKKSNDWIMKDVESSSKAAYDKILAIAGPTAYVYQNRVSEEERRRAWVMMLVTINAAKIAHYSKNRTLGEATILYGFFECLRLMKLNLATRETNSPPNS
jgi:hypothetical protein